MKSRAAEWSLLTSLFPLTETRSSILKDLISSSFRSSLTCLKSWWKQKRQFPFPLNCPSLIMIQADSFATFFHKDFSCEIWEVWRRYVC